MKNKPTHRELLARRGFLRWTATRAAGVMGAASLARRLSILAAADAPLPGEAICPKSAPPATTLFALRIGDLGQHSESCLPLSCLQGLVNRKQPQIYLAYDQFDEQWLDWLQHRGDVREIRWVRPQEIYQMFLPVAKGLVVTDPQLPASVNVATMLCAAGDVLPVSPALAQNFRDKKVLIDLRGRWKKNIEAYRWFYASYGSTMSRRICAAYDPAQFELRDYLVEFKVPLIWVSHPKDNGRCPAASAAEEARFARDLLGALSPNIPCLGWWGNGVGGEEGCGENGPYSGNELASGYAKFHVCSAWDGYARGASNLSVHSGTSATFHQKPAPAPPPLQSRKVYYTFTRTDGDGPNFWRQVYRDLWNQPDHGKVPVGWQLGPATHDLMPDILDYFYKHASRNDVFVNALTGAGYIREAQYGQQLPANQQDAVWDQYMAISGQYLKRLDLSLLTTFEAFEPMPPKHLARFAKMPGLQAIFGNYHRVESTTAENATSEVEGLPLFRAIIRGGDSLAAPESFKRAIATATAQIRQFTPARRPAFLHVSLTNWMVDTRVLVEISRELGPDYIAVRPDHLAELYKTARKGS